ncbi:hypothetical protein BH10BAC3_BH10BAC3_26200 [soil metagenome]
MNETFEYIEFYFQNKLDATERISFENRCAADEAFSNEVAFYISTRQALRSKLLKDKQSKWNEESGVRQVPVKAPSIKIYQQQWFRYSVAASVIIVASVFYLLKPADTKSLAQQYLNENYQQLSLTMGSATDSIEMGKVAYNNKEYDKAVIFFEAVAKSHPDNADAKQFAGLVYLMKGNYDKAIETFDALARMKGLYSNPGLFLEASGMLLRNENDDFKKAKGLLEQVADQNLEGREQAAKWLKKL